MFSHYFPSSYRVKPQEFLKAAAHGNLATITKYIEENKENPLACNVVNEEGHSALMQAIFISRIDIVKALLSVPTLDINATSSIRGCVLSISLYMLYLTHETASYEDFRQSARDIIYALLRDKRLTLTPTLINEIFTQILQHPQHSSAGQLLLSELLQHPNVKNMFMQFRAELIQEMLITRDHSHRDFFLACLYMILDEIKLHNKNSHFDKEAGRAIIDAFSSSIETAPTDEIMEFNEFMALMKENKLQAMLARGGALSSWSLWIYTCTDKNNKRYIIVERRQPDTRMPAEELAKLYSQQRDVISDLMAHRNLRPCYGEKLNYINLKNILREHTSDFMSGEYMAQVYPLLKIESDLETLREIVTQPVFPNAQALANVTTDFVRVDLLGDGKDSTEGEWADTRYVNQDIFNRSKELFEQNSLQPRQLDDLRRRIELAEYRDGICRDLPVYPLPNAEKWQEQDKVYTLLSLLSKHARKYSRSFFWQTDYQGRNNLPYTDSQELNWNLRNLASKLEKITPGTCLPCSKPKLFAPDINDAVIHYTITLPDGYKLKWSDHLLSYIKYYNIKPSKEFLMKLSVLEQLMQEHKKDAMAFIGLMDEVANKTALAESSVLYRR